MLLEVEEGTRSGRVRVRIRIGVKVRRRRERGERAVVEGGDDLKREIKGRDEVGN